MEQTKHKSLPFNETIEVNKILGKKVLTKDGKRIGKVKGIHVDPKDLTIEGINVDTGMFYVDHYFDKSYVKLLNNEGAILKVNPATDILKLNVFDSDGKEVGTVTKANRSKLTNKLLSIVVDIGKEEATITADYISTIGHSVMLKEPFEKGKWLDSVGQNQE